MKSAFWGLGKSQEKMAERLEKLVVAGKKVKLFGTVYLPDVIVIKI